ncbi:MAG TPA: hypothetical protein ENF23_06570 [Methanosarcinales archaeon]|nr:hypothetical protein [Methanosarcinales archaeon]
MSHIVFKNFIENPGITWSKVSYDEYISVRIEMLSKKGFDGLRIFVVVKFIRNWATCSIIKQC